jgi:hypothetical protein
VSLVLLIVILTRLTYLAFVSCMCEI